MSNQEQSKKASKLKQFLEDINTDKQTENQQDKKIKVKKNKKLKDNLEVLENNATDQKNDLGDTKLYSKVNVPNNEFLDNFSDIEKNYSKKNRQAPLEVVPRKSKFETVVAKNTLIKGTIYSDDGIEVSGKVIGDIECKDDLLVTGRIKGITSSQNAELLDAVIDGALSCTGELFVNNNSWVVGNLKSLDAQINGKIKGNINTRDTLLVGNDAVVMGDISTSELEVKKGAFVNGNVSMYQASKEVIDTFESLVDE